MLEIVLTTYGAVFVAEIMGDKLLYGSGVLATRYRWSGVIAGMCLAFMGKMSVAVAVGSTIGHLLPRWLVATVTAISFLGVAAIMWRKPDLQSPKERDDRMLKGAAVTFGVIFLSEWGDKGMATAGAWAAAWASQAHGRSMRARDVAVLVWIGAVLAMMTKGGLAVTLGASVRQWIADHIEPRYVRVAGVGALMVLGLLSVVEVMQIPVD